MTRTSTIKLSTETIKRIIELRSEGMYFEDIDNLLGLKTGTGKPMSKRNDSYKVMRRVGFRRMLETM